MFCHEGPWHKVDRIWTIRTDGTHSQRFTRARWPWRSSAMSSGAPMGRQSGTTCRPRGRRFLARGYDIETGARTLVSPAAQRVVDSLQRLSATASCSAAMAATRDKLRARGTVSGSTLFRPELIENRGIDDKSFVQPGFFALKGW